MKVAKIASGGRITIPSELRKKYNLKSGMKIVIVEKDGKLIIQALNKKYFDEIAGILDLKEKMIKSFLNEKEK